MTDNNVSPSAHITSQTPLLPAIRSWEIYLQDQDRSPYTIKAFVSDLQLLTAYLPPDRTLGSITTNDLNHFLQWLQHGRGVPCSPKTLARRITSIKSFFRWLHNSGSLQIDPAEKVVQQSVVSPLPQILTEEEQDAVLEMALSYRRAEKPDARPYTLLRLLLSSGVKKGECLSIHINHVDTQDPDNPFLFIRYTDPRYRYKERKIQLPEDWVSSYQEYISQYQPTEQLFPWSPRRLEYLLEEIGDKAGLEKHLSFDMCRWTSAYNDKATGIENEKLRQKLGVSKIQWREINQKLRRLGGWQEDENAQENNPD